MPDFTPRRAALTRAAVLALLPAVGAGCGTTRMTDSSRTATEQLLISNAIDQSVSRLDFRMLAGQKVFFDAQYLDGTVDKGYLVSSMRQHLLANGCLLQEDRNKATYVVEARSGGVGTNNHSLLVGVPQMNVPSLVPGQPSQIPEIPLVKKTDQQGHAKVAVFAYNRITGERLWQSGTQQARSTSKDTWVLGAGPFQNGSIRQGTNFVGEPLPQLNPFDKGPPTGPAQAAPKATPVTERAAWAPQLTAPPPEKTERALFADVRAAGPMTRFALAAVLQAQLEAAPNASGVQTAGHKEEQPAPARTASGLPQPSPPPAPTPEFKLQPVPSNPASRTPVLRGLRR
jgi:hypothetical protein